MEETNRVFFGHLIRQTTAFRPDVQKFGPPGLSEGDHHWVTTYLEDLLGLGAAEDVVSESVDFGL